MICLFYSSYSPLPFSVSDRAAIKHELTPLFESFRVALDEVSARGDTAVYDALDVARSNLTQFRQDIPGLRRRIIIVSDGDDTSSKNMPTNVCAALQRDGIIVDSVQVGYTHNSILHAISVATGTFCLSCLMSLAKVRSLGGYRFSPRTSLGDALSIFVCFPDCLHYSHLSLALYAGSRNHALLWRASPEI